MRPVLRLVLLCALASPRARAQDDAAVAHAREAYDRGAAAFDARDYGKAALELARADELAPNATVLELAFSAAARTSDAPTIMDLCDRIEKRIPESAKLHVQARGARVKAAREVGQVTVVCPPPALFCKATLDGQLVAIGVRRYVRPGEHAVELSADGNPEKLVVTVTSGAQVEVKPTPPSSAPTEARKPAPPPAPVATVTEPMGGPQGAASTTPIVAKRDGLSPAWFWAGLAATAIVGGVTVWSAFDTQSKHDAFTATPNPNTQGDGRDSQLRTNILGLASVGLAVSTTVLGVFAVSWSRGPAATVGARF